MVVLQEAWHLEEQISDIEPVPDQIYSGIWIGHVPMVEETELNKEDE